MMKKIRDMLNQPCMVVLFFAAFLLYGLLTVKDYGISTDELIERESSLITWRYIMPSSSDLVTETVNFPELTPLKEYKDRYYGMAAQLPAVFVEYMSGFRLDIRKVFLMRHLYNFLMFFTATVFFYKMCRKLGHGRGMSLLGVSLLILMPRILANAYYNIKDIMFLSVFVITLYFGFLCIEDMTSWKRLIPFAFCGALCTNIRIVGAMAAAVCFVVAFVKSLSEKRGKETFCFCLAGAVFCFGFYFIMTPVIWEDTWREIMNLADTFSNYVVWYAYTWFMGEYILSTELPWYYLLVNIGITTPVFFLAAFFCGAVGMISGGIKSLAKRQWPDETGWYYIALAVNLTVPFVYVIVKRPVLYNGWRHFYFVYPMMALVMLYGIDRIRRLFVGRFARLAYWSFVAGAGLLPVTAWIVRNHPHEYVFFNRLALPYVTEYFQKDYWNVSQYELLRFACEQDGREEMKVWILPENAIVFLPPEHRGRVRQTAVQNDADYIVTAYTDFCEKERLAQYYLYEEDRAVITDGVKISSLFRRAYDPVFRTELEENGETLRYHMGGMEWEMVCEGEETTLHGKSNFRLDVSRLFIQGPDGPFMDTVEILVSEDGEHYTPLQLIRELDSVETDRIASCQGKAVTDIIIRHKKAGRAVFSLSLLAGRMPGGKPAEMLSAIEEADASSRTDQAKMAWDGNLESRWSSGTAQKEGMYYSIRLKETERLSGLVLDSGTSPGDEGKNLSVFYSEDGKNWFRAAAETKDGIRYTFAPIVCRYIRLEVGAVDAENINNWSIHEIGLIAETAAK